MTIGLFEAARNMLTQSLNVQTGETLLIVSDGTRDEICRKLYTAGTSLGAETIILEMKPRQRSGEEPPKLVALAMQQADVVICPTEHSLTHTKARKNASDSGARVATMPGITLGMFENGPMTADYRRVAALSRTVADILSKGKNVRIEKNGAIFECSLEGRTGIASTGVYSEKGQ